MAYPDTAVGTDSHTTMVNGLGVLAWGVGGIEAEAAMLGQPVTMLIPEVVGVPLGRRVARRRHRDRPRAHGHGNAAQEGRRRQVRRVLRRAVFRRLPVADRTTIGNMSPEFGSTVAIFPIDDRTLDYLRLTGRSPERIALVEAYAKAQGLFRTDDDAGSRVQPTFCNSISSSVEPSLAGPRRPAGSRRRCMT